MNIEDKIIFIIKQYKEISPKELLIVMKDLGYSNSEIRNTVAKF